MYPFSLLQSAEGKGILMKIIVRYEKRFKRYELLVFEIKNWLNIDFLPDETEEAFQARAQKLVDEKYNRPEYNVMHKQTRHKGVIASVKDEKGDFESRMKAFRNTSIFFKDEIDREEVEDYEAVKGFVYAVLKPDVADLFMDVRIRCIPINEKAASMLKRDEFATEAEYNKAVARLANNITQKLKRAKQKLKKNFVKASDFGIRRGYKVGGINSSNNN